MFTSSEEGSFSSVDVRNSGVRVVMDSGMEIEIELKSLVTSGVFSVGALSGLLTLAAKP